MAADFEKLIAIMPFAGHLGITLVEASSERVVADLPWAPQLCTSGGIMHGGVLMSLADTVGALVVVLGLAEGEVDGHDHVDDADVPPGHRRRRARYRPAGLPGPDDGDASRPACTTPTASWSARRRQVQAIRQA